MRSIASASSVAGLSAGLDLLAEAEVTGLADDELRSEVVALVTAGHRLQAELARRVEAFDHRRLAGSDGSRTTRAWLQSFTRISGRAAHRLVKRARVLSRFPRLLRAAQAGAVSPEHVAQVARLVDQVGAEADRAEPVLVAAASTLDVESFAVVCDRVRAHVDPDGPDPERAFAARGLTLSPATGSLLLRGQLDAEGGATLATALDALMTPPTDGDERTAPQRRADALVELARRSLTTGQLPTVGGQRPQVGLLLYPQSLSPSLLRELAVAQRGGPLSDRLAAHLTASATAQAAAGDGADPATDSAATDPVATDPATLPVGSLPPSWSDPPFLDHIGPVSPAVAQRIACDADVWRIILDPATGAPLDVGRSHRLVPHWIRKALHVRDRGCRFPGCHTPAVWSDAHHLIPWAEGGTTTIDNCVLLCRHHHGLVHEGGWTIRMCRDSGQVSVARPGGVPYTTTIPGSPGASPPSAGPPSASPPSASPSVGPPRALLDPARADHASSQQPDPGGSVPGNGVPGNGVPRSGAPPRRSAPWHGPSSRAA